ncbi:MAG: AAA family ATPase [Planctomycetota bacterium]
MPPLRFAVVGGESTGKSTLAQMLADALGCPLATEFARDYLLEHGADYTPDQSLDIAHGQLAREDAAFDQAVRDHQPCIVCDTDALSTLIWSEFYFKTPHPGVAQLANQRRYALHLLCTHDHLPWHDDGLRQSPTSRPWFTQRFTEALAQRRMPFTLINQPLDERLDVALQHIRPLLAEASD